jgi:hypothetical protein
LKRYILVSTILAIALCVAVALFNYRVDPWGVYHYEGATDDGLGRIDLLYHLRLIKPWLVVQARPTAVIAGTSRSATVDPRHAAWPNNHSYNLSIPGQTVYEMLRFIEHAQANGPLDKLTIALDFEAFILPEPRVRLDFKEARLARNAADLSSVPFYLQGLRDIRDTLFSMDGLARSLAAITGTSRADRSYFRNGTWVSTDSTFTGQLGYVYVGKKNVMALLTQQFGLDANFKTLADILRFAHQQKIDTRLFITPEHVFVVDLWARVGYAELWNEFHRRLVAVNDAVAQEMGVEPFPLFGFNQLQGVVDEPIRKGRDADRSLFTDGSHFRPALGDRIMDGVWTDGSDVGTRIDANTVEQYLSQVEQLRQQFESNNAQVTAMLRHEISPELD